MTTKLKLKPIEHRSEEFEDIIIYEVPEQIGGGIIIQNKKRLNTIAYGEFIQYALQNYRCLEVFKENIFGEFLGILAEKKL